MLVSKAAAAAWAQGRPAWWQTLMIWQDARLMHAGLVTSPVVLWPLPLQVAGKCYDIICPANMECYEHGDWFEVEPYMPSREPWPACPMQVDCIMIVCLGSLGSRRHALLRCHSDTAIYAVVIM